MSHVVKLCMVNEGNNRKGKEMNAKNCQGDIVSYCCGVDAHESFFPGGSTWIEEERCPGCGNGCVFVSPEEFNAKLHTVVYEVLYCGKHRSETLPQYGDDIRLQTCLTEKNMDIYLKNAENFHGQRGNTITVIDMRLSTDSEISSERYMAEKIWNARRE